MTSACANPEHARVLVAKSFDDSPSGQDNLLNVSNFLYECLDGMLAGASDDPSRTSDQL